MSSHLLHCEYGGKAHGCGWGLIRWTSATVVFPLRRPKRMGPMGDVRWGRDTLRGKGGHSENKNPKAVFDVGVTCGRLIGVGG